MSNSVHTVWQYDIILRHVNTCDANGTGQRQWSIIVILSTCFFLVYVNKGCTWGDVRFTRDTYLASVNETAVNSPRPLPGFVTVACTHSLDNSTSNITYQLLNSNNTFTINMNTGELTAILDLDYETTTFYHILVQCCSELNVTWSAEAQLNITILPINEYRPTVSTKTEQISIPEGTPIGTVIISTISDGFARTYSASDLDAGPHGNIYYSIVFTTDNKTFEFNSTVGALYLASDFDLDADRITFRREVIEITACDSEPPTPDCLNIIVTVFLSTGNDNAPVFISSLLNVSFPESLVIGTTIAVVECIDEDFSRGVLDGYEIMSVFPSQTPQETFIVTESGNITIGETLDFELTDLYEVRVRCFDSDFEDFATVRVSISAVNDNTPRFVELSLNVSFPESVRRFATIAQVTCNDDDVLIGELSGYEIISLDPPQAPNDTFSINSTGTIKLALFLDFEMVQVYELEVRCFDSGTPIKESVSVVTVNVIPVNEHSPKFQNSSSKNVSVLESINVTTVVAQVECSDRDLSQGAFAGYELVSISPPQTPQETFVISSTGTIVVGLPLDSELIDSYELQIRCYDSGYPVMEDFTAVRVSLIDVNDNSPQCSQVPIHYLPTGTHSHKHILTINCTDEDNGLNGKLRYTLGTISPLLSSGSVAVNLHTGENTFIGTINENVNYTIVILVSDLGTPSRSTNVSFVVSIVGVVPPMTHLFPLWGIILIVEVGLLLVCCLLIGLMCCYYGNFLRKRAKQYLIR